jgi:hypothetical protein
MVTIDRLRWIKPFPQVIEWPNLPGFFPRASKHGTSFLSPGKLPRMPRARSLEKAIYGLKPGSVSKISTLFWKQEALNLGIILSESGRSGRREVVMQIIE